MLRNSASEPQHRFEIAASDLIRTQALADAAGLRIIAFYHSHPRGEARASTEDLRAATPWQRMLILAPEADPQWRAYVYSQEGWVEEPIVVGAK